MVAAMTFRPPGRAEVLFKTALGANNQVGSRNPAGQDGPQYCIVEYRVYVQSILQPLRPESLCRVRDQRKLVGRALLEDALEQFISQLKEYVTGCDDRKFSKAALRRARGIESQLSNVCEKLLVPPIAAGVLAPVDLHGVWRGFSTMRGWRDSRVPQESLLAMLRGALQELDDDEAENWKNQALTYELTLPEVHQCISVSAWPALCELLSRLPDFVTPAELREALWQQSFVENPTHAPDYRNYRRFANLAQQMVTVGVELESEKVEHLVHQTLDLDRPWRERRDILSGILSAASVDDRQKLVKNLDRRFEEHADLDDFEIVCGIAEHLGTEIPREGAIRRCALRRWALDPKRGGALPVARLIDFVDGDTTIGTDVATDLRKRGRIADAAVLLSRLPKIADSGDADPNILDVNNGDAELARLQELLAFENEIVSGGGVFGPVEEAAMRLPFEPQDGFGYSQIADDAVQAVANLAGARVIALGIWREEAPFWHSPPTMLAMCTENRAELFDLVHLRNNSLGGWAEASNKLRAVLSDPNVLKVSCGEDSLHTWANTLGLGIANTLKRGDREPLGPLLNLTGVVTAVLGRSVEDPACAWPAVVNRFLGLRLCPEEADSNWARRPLRASQLHHAAVEAWTQLPVLQALCSYNIVPPVLARRQLTAYSKVKFQFGRKQQGAKSHQPGQLAPAGRLASAEGTLAPLSAQATAAALDAASAKAALEAGQVQLPFPTHVAMLTHGVAADHRQNLPALAPGQLVEVFEERFGGRAVVAPLASVGSLAKRTVPSCMLLVTNGWECPAWVAGLPRPGVHILREAEDAAAAEEAAALAAATPVHTGPTRPTAPAPVRSSARAGHGSNAASSTPPMTVAQRQTLAKELVAELYNMSAVKITLQNLYETQR